MKIETDASLRTAFRRRCAAIAAVVFCLMTASLAAAESGSTSAEATPDRAASDGDVPSGGADSSQTSPAARLVRQARRAYGEGHWFEAQMQYEDARDASPEGSPVRVQALLGLGTLLWQRGNYSNARSHIDRALEEARSLELHAAIGRLLLAKGHIQASTGDFSDAERTLDLCGKLAAEQSDEVFGPLCRINRRLVRKLQGKSVPPEADYRQILASLRESDSPLMVGMSLAKSAELSADGGASSRALSLLDRASEQYRRAGSEPATARNRVLRARLLQNQGRWDEARRNLKGLVEKFRQMGAKPAEIDTLGLLARDARRRGRFERARARLQRGRRLAREIEDRRSVAQTDLSLCEVGAAGGEIEVQTCRSARRALEELGLPSLVARARSAAGRLFQRRGANAEARDAFLEAIAIRQERVHPSVRNESAMRTDRANLCQVENSLEMEGAFHRCREAAEHLERASSPDSAKLAATHYSAGTAAAREGELESAAEHLRRAAQRYGSDRLDDPASVARSRLRLGGVHRRTGDRQAAAEVFRRGLEEFESDEGPPTEGSESFGRSFRTQLAQELVALEKWEEARSVLEGLLERAERAGDPADRAWALSTLARVDSRTGDDERARGRLERALPVARSSGDEELVETIRENLGAFDSD